MVAELLYALCKENVGRLVSQIVLFVHDFAFFFLWHGMLLAIHHLFIKFSQSVGNFSLAPDLENLCFYIIYLLFFR